jgi:thiosulfate reductase cytochrome b subunit
MIYQYPVYIRIWHLLNALFFLLLILTGLSMQYSDPNAPLISFPVSVKMHNISGIGLTLNYLVFFIGNLISKNGRNYRIQWKGEKERLMKQLRYYTRGYFRKENPPFPIGEERKFNPLQAFTYAIAMYAGVPVLFITGWGLLFPETVLEKVFGVSGLLVTDLLHVITGFLLSIFMVVHIYLCTIGAHPISNFRAILTGWHERNH